MYFNSGYLNNSRLDFKDYSKPLVVGSCGTYRLKKRPKLPTFWAKGRRDYQILYVASGKAHFWFDGVEEVVTSGHMVLYQPKEIQKYVYYTITPSILVGYSRKSMVSVRHSTERIWRNLLKNEKNSLTTRSCRNCGRKHTSTICPSASVATAGWELACRVLPLGMIR